MDSERASGNVDVELSSSTSWLRLRGAAMRCSSDPSCPATRRSDAVQMLALLLLVAVSLGGSGRACGGGFGRVTAVTAEAGGV